MIKNCSNFATMIYAKYISAVLTDLLCANEVSISTHTHTHTHTHTENRAFRAFLPIREHIHSRSFSVFREGTFFLPQRTEHLNL